MGGFIPQGSGSDLVVSKGRKELFHAIGDDTRLISTDNVMVQVYDYIHSVFQQCNAMYIVQVRAKTSVAEGRWSELVPLGKFCQCVITPSSMLLYTLNASFLVQVARIPNVPLALYE